MAQEMYIYSSGEIVASTTADATVTEQISIMQDADFDVSGITIQVEQATVLVTSWNGLIQITSDDTGKTWFNEPIPIEALRGTGQQPYPLTGPKRVTRGTSLTIAITNNVVTATSVWVNLHGKKVA